MKIIAASAVVAALISGLAGCTFSGHANLTGPRSAIAATAEKALAKAVGSTTLPKISCGSGRVDLVKGKKLNCVLTDPSDGTRYKTVVTLTSVKGLHYTVDAKVANSPLG
jgi:hypothetical protein